ncbi:MAG TPA: SLC13 family permease [Blastocatellia bacterium]|nr:SLC13 family permease [Blastocatellia bacterium]
MTPQIAFVLGLFLVALALFAFEIFAVDIVALFVLLALTIPKYFGMQILTPTEAFSAFGDETVLLLIGDFMLTIGLVRTGVTAEIGRRLFTMGSKRPWTVVPMLLIVAACVSFWMSNTVTTAVFLPIAIGLTQRMGISPSKVLMPLAFSIILGGTVTLIGTSTNLVISGRLPDYGMKGISLFELTPVGLTLTVVGMLYIFFVGQKLIPERHKGGELTTDYKMRDYLAELLVLPGSSLVGREVRNAQIGERLDLNILGLIRGKTQTLSPSPDLVIEAGDLLLVEGKVANIMRIKDIAGIEILADVKLRDPDLTSKDVELAELTIMPGSWQANRTLKESRFRERQSLTVLAINHHGGVRRNKLSHTRLRPGDVLLVQGARVAIERIGFDRNNFMVLGEVPSSQLVRSNRAKIALVIFVLSVVVGSVGLLPFSIAFILGVVLMFLTGCLTPEEAYRGVNWEMMVLIACMIAFGDAMEKTGSARYLADLVVVYVSPYGVFAVMSAFFLLTVFLTQPMSNQASALVVLPIAVGAATSIGMNPRTLVMVVVFAASCSFLTPLEPSCIMVYGPGRYRFRDFVVAGAGLTVIVYIVGLAMVPLIWNP